jgi:hypothetical protein
MSTAATAAAAGTIYFGYGSNLWAKQMHTRCPDSTFLGIGRLASHNWIINSRGYANVARINASTPPVDAGFPEAWGAVYRLSGSDEARLDRNEGVPYAYTKERLGVEFWPVREAAGEEEGGREGEGRTGGKQMTMLVYVDYRRAAWGRPQEEYVYRMNRGIEDALRWGVPRGYVERVVRKFIPGAEGLDGGRSEVLALKQAEEFVDPGTYTRGEETGGV